MDDDCSPALAAHARSHVKLSKATHLLQYCTSEKHSRGVSPASARRSSASNATGEKEVQRRSPVSEPQWLRLKQSGVETCQGRSGREEAGRSI